MDASLLAQKMLEWEKAKRALDALTAEIEEAVMGIGQTQTVGNVRASYSAGRKKYDHKAGFEASGFPEEALDVFRVTTVDYRAACKELGITTDDMPFTQSEPSVSVKLLN